MSKKAKIAAQDYTDIQNLYACYNMCSDAGDSAGYAACFTVDGALHNQTFKTTVQGRDNLVAFKIKEAGTRKDKYRRHWNGSLYLERIDEDTIRGRCYLHGYTGEPGHFAELRDVAVYEDTLRKEDGEWKFANRILMMDAAARMGSKQP